MIVQDVINKNVLFSPLNWGMGHVSRSISILKQLQDQQNNVFVACNADSRLIYEEYLTGITFIDHADYPFLFSGEGNFERDIKKSFWKLKKRLKNERKEVETYVQKYNIDLVLSDHRYGFISSVKPSIFITHQLNLPITGYKKIANFYHKILINKFRSVWVLDYSDSRLAGKLSWSSGRKNTFYIGPYSRFSLSKNMIEQNEKTIIIASGPDVYAQQLVDDIARLNSVVFDVVCSENINLPKSMIKIVGGWKMKDQAIMNAKHIISRSGYSTIMDLEILNRKATLIPTPGQAEQEYLSTLR